MVRYRNKLVEENKQLSKSISLNGVHLSLWLCLLALCVSDLWEYTAASEMLNAFHLMW